MVRIGIKLALLFVLVYAGVTVWYGRLEQKLRQLPALTAKPRIEAPVEKTELKRRPDDFTVIVTRNIFGAALTKENTGKAAEVQKALEPTKLKLSLMGTISGNERDARAIISDDAKRQQDIYQVGDSIQGAMVKSIERGKVVLSVNSKDEVLTLKDREGGGPDYQPSPSDYYQEPPEPQVQEPQAEVPTAYESGQGIQEGPAGSTPPAVNKPPAVRPRPIRRSPNLRPRVYRGGSNQPGNRQ